MVAKSDAKTLSEVGFEIHKRAGKLQKEGNDILDGFQDEMRKKMSILSDEKRVEFMHEFRQNMDAKIDTLSVKEARQMGFMGRKDKSGKDSGCMMGKNMGCENGFKMIAGMWQKDGRPCGKKW